jgi:FkbH-like protein
MRLRTALVDALRAVVRHSDELLVVQSSLFHIATSVESLKWEAVAAINSMAEAGHTIALPAFTFSAIRLGRYHHRHSHSESGQLADWVYGLPEACRTPHPIYSYVVLGPRSDDLLSCRHDAAFGQGTVFELFEIENARIVMLGADWQELTQVHRYEELARVPYRESMRVRGIADFGEGESPFAVDIFVRDVLLNSVLDFSPVIDDLMSIGAIDQVTVGRGTMQATSCDSVRMYAERAIAKDPYAFVRHPRLIERRVQRLTLDPLRLATVGAQNVELVAEALREAGEVLLDCRPLLIHVPPFGQHVRELLDDASPLHKSDPQCTVFVDRIEDLYDTIDLDSVEQFDLGPLDRHIGLLEEYAKVTTHPIVVLGFAELRWRPTVLDGSSTSPTRQAVAFGNERLVELASRHPNVHVLDLSTLASAVAGPVIDDRLWHVGRMPFSKSFGRHLAERIWGLVLASHGQSARLLVVDLDETLWGGVLGEDDISGIALGGDYPGSAFTHFQRTLRSLRRAGLMIALCSKNDEAHALRVFRERPEMVLREDDIVAWRIDWRPKVEKVAELVAEVGIDFEHVLFVDNDPVEREAIRQQLPAVKVLDLPADPARYVDALAACPFLARTGVTDEDRARTERYRARRLIEDARGRCSDPEAFYASLDMNISFVPLSDANVARAEQLSQKTNQFNTTSRRYLRGDLKALAASTDVDVAVVALADRFSERDHMGLIVVCYDADCQTAEIDSFLLSCRVLGRGVEQAVLAWICERARDRGVSDLRGMVVETPRNGPCRDVYAQAGFNAGTQQGMWRLDLLVALPRWPSWLQHHEELSLKR